MGDAGISPADPLNFVDKRPYVEKLKSEQKRTGLRDAAIVGSGMIRARRVALAVTDSAFFMGSMGSVVGEKLTRTIERATEQGLPLIIIFRFRWWCPYARRRAVADADGQSFCRTGSTR